MATGSRRPARRGTTCRLPRARKKAERIVEDNGRADRRARSRGGRRATMPTTSQSRKSSMSARRQRRGAAAPQPLVRDEPARIPPADQDAGEVGEAVPAHRERADGDGDRIDGGKGDGEHAGRRTREGGGPSRRHPRLGQAAALRGKGAKHICRSLNIVQSTISPLFAVFARGGSCAALPER